MKNNDAGLRANKSIVPTTIVPTIVEKKDSAPASFGSASVARDSVEPASAPQLRQAATPEFEQPKRDSEPYPAKPFLSSTAEREPRNQPVSVEKLRDFQLFATQSEPKTGNRRFYIGVILAALIAGLTYVMYRSANSSSGAAQKNLPSQTTQPAEQVDTPPAAAAPAERSTENAAAKNTSAGNEAPAPAGAPAADIGRTADVKPSSAPAKASAPPSAHVAAGTGSGAEEFATAQKYLTATETRDPSQAVQFLWKAVSKGNLAATLALSDLYLRGDGVAKSCDQARLLLEVAARKGSAAASQQLEHLQTFDCQ